MSDEDFSLLPVKLIPYQPEFLEPFLQWRNQPATIRHNPLQAMSDAETARMLEAEGSDLANLKNHATFRWFVEFEEKIVGSVSLKNISHSMGYAETGYGISQTYHRRGIGTAAVAQLVEKVFSETSLRKLLAYVHDANLASCKLLEKLGFVQEGFLREHYVINGQAENEVLYALLKKDWADM